MLSTYLMRVQMHANSQPLVMRWLLLLAILSIELIAITARFDAPTLFSPDLENSPIWSAWLFDFSREIWPAGLWVAGSILCVLTPKFKAIYQDLRSLSIGNHWVEWLGIHLFVLVLFVALTALIFGKPTDPARLSAVWFSCWFAMGIATLSFWLLALAPGRFWLHLVSRQSTPLLCGTLLGLVVAWMTILMFYRHEAPFAQNELWNSLAIPTLQLVHLLLGWVYSDLVYQPDIFLLGTDSFRVTIFGACSGIEGIALISLFLVIYLWLFRKTLRFPQVFWLFPLGIIVIWLANIVRIAMLIMIGASFSPEVALQGFHSQAGWIAFTLIALGAIALMNRMQFFSVANPDVPLEIVDKPLAVAMLVPLLVLMAAAMLTSAFSSGFDLLYPLRVVAVAATLFYFRHVYSGLGWTWSWQAPVIGIAVFILWILLETNVDGNITVIPEGLAELPGWAAVVWLAFRVLGSVITVPLAEELAFRGFLLRKLIAKDFENVPLGQFSWLSFLVSSVLFGLLHERWLAGILAGMAYALAVYRRGQLGDAVIAHMTTNALIALFVLTQAKWSLW